MHPPGTVLSVGSDVSDAIVRGWIRSGKAVFVGAVVNGCKIQRAGGSGDKHLEEAQG